MGARRPRIVTALFVAGAAFFALGGMLLVIAVAAEKWAFTDGTTENNPVGAVRVTHEVGLFITQVTECCQSHGQIVPDQGTVCNLHSNSGGCTVDRITTAEYCEFTRRKEEASAHGSVDCTAVEAGVIVSMIIVLLILIGTVALLALLALRRANAGGLGAVSALFVLGTIIVLIVVNEAVFDEHVSWVKSRYASTRNLSPPPFKYELKDSYKLTAASLAMWCVSTIIGASIFGFEYRKQSEKVAPPTRARELVMSPEPIRGTNPIRFSHTREDALPLCPHDTMCEEIDELAHQLDFAHTCRLPFCTDTSAGHRRHFVHSYSVAGK